MPITQIDLQKSLANRLLIIGCGDIGQRLAQKITPQGYQVTGLRRSLIADLPHLHYTVCDVTEADSLKPILATGFDVIVISMTPSERSDAGYQRAYVDTCRNLVHSLRALQQQPRLVIFVSSTGVYAQDDGSWINEDSPTTPETFSGKRLLEAEQIIADSGFTHTIVRFSGIYGPGRNRLIEQVVQQRASASSAYTNRIHADDCAGVLAYLIKQSEQQALAPLYLATDSSPTPMVDVVSWIAAQLEIEKFLSLDATNERGNKRISNQRLLQCGYQFIYKDYQQGYTDMLKSYAEILKCRQ